MSTALIKKADLARQNALAAAAQKREVFNKIRSEIKDSDIDLSKPSDAFNKLDQASNELSQADAQAEAANQQYLRVLEIEGHDAGFKKLETRDEALSYAEQVLQNAEYQRTARDSQGGLGIGGTVAISKAMKQKEFMNTLVGSGSSGAGAFVKPHDAGVVPLGDSGRSILDFITVGATDSPVVEYVEVTSPPSSAAFTAAATTVAASEEDGAKPEGAVTFTLKTANVQTVAELIPVGRAAYNDAPQMVSQIEQLLYRDLRRKTESQIIKGNGSGANLTGILSASGVNSVSYDADSNIGELIREGITAVRVDDEEPDYVLMNPADAEALDLIRNSIVFDTGDDSPVVTGGYLFSNPLVGGLPTIWGKPIIEHNEVTAGTVILGTRSRANLWIHEGARLFVSDSHKDWFQRNVLALLAEARLAFAVTKPDAFCKIAITSG